MTLDRRLGVYAHTMRRNPTEPEKRLWRQLSASKLGGHKFRRQAVIGQSIVDFLLPSKALIVEIDGDTHEAGLDRARDAALHECGFHTLRFSNSDVMSNMEGVLQTILSIAESLPDRWSKSSDILHPNPSSEEEGLSVARNLSPSSSEEEFGVEDALPGRENAEDKAKHFRSVRHPTC